MSTLLKSILIAILFIITILTVEILVSSQRLTALESVVYADSIEQVRETIYITNAVHKVIHRYGIIIEAVQPVIHIGDIRYVEWFGDTIPAKILKIRDGNYWVEVLRYNKIPHLTWYSRDELYSKGIK